MNLRALSDKRGITISMPTIIITILSILVLIIVALSFTGGMTQLILKIKQVSGIAVSEEAATDLARQQCESWCSAGREKAFCDGVLKISISKGEQKWYGCERKPEISSEESAKGAKGEDLDISCPKLTPCK